jgi:hypothetical protein
VPAFNLGRMLLFTKRIDEAEPYIARAVALRRTLPEAHPLRMLSETLEGQRLLARGDLAAAQTALATLDAIVVAQSELPPPMRAVVEEFRADIAKSRGDSAARRHALTTAATIAERALAADSVPLAVKHLALAEAELADGDRAAAQARYQRIAPVLRGGALVEGAASLARLEALERAFAVP